MSGNREARLTVGAEVLQKDLVLGDMEVGVVAERTEWGAEALTSISMDVRDD